MALKKPICLYDGIQRPLQNGDVVPESLGARAESVARVGQSEAFVASNTASEANITASEAAIDASTASTDVSTSKSIGVRAESLASDAANEASIANSLVDLNTDDISEAKSIALSAESFAIVGDSLADYVQSYARVYSSHSNLDGLNQQDHSAAAILSSTAQFDKRLSEADNDVQAALRALDSYPFGLEFNYAEDNTVSSTTSTTYVQKLRLSLISIPAGTYFILWSFEWRYDGSNDDFFAQVEIDDTTQIMEMEVEPVYTGNWHPASGHRVIDLTAGNHTIDIDYRTTDSGKTAYIDRARITVFRVE